MTLTIIVWCNSILTWWYFQNYYNYTDATVDDDDHIHDIFDEHDNIANIVDDDNIHESNFDEDDLYIQWFMCTDYKLDVIIYHFIVSIQISGFLFNKITYQLLYNWRYILCSSRLCYRKECGDFTDKFSIAAYYFSYYVWRIMYGVQRFNPMTPNNLPKAQNLKKPNICTVKWSTFNLFDKDFLHTQPSPIPKEICPAPK